MSALRQWLRKKFIDYLIHDLFVAVDPTDIFWIKDGVGFFNGRRLEREDLDRIKSDAERFRKSFLWQVMKRQLRYKASELIAYKSKTTDDILAGKQLLYVTQVMEETVETIIRS